MGLGDPPNAGAGDQASLGCSAASCSSSSPSTRYPPGVTTTGRGEAGAPGQTTTGTKAVRSESWSSSHRACAAGARALPGDAMGRSPVGNQAARGLGGAAPGGGGVAVTRSAGSVLVVEASRVGEVGGWLDRLRGSPEPDIGLSDQFEK